MPNPEGLVVWAQKKDHADSLKLSQKLHVPLVVQEEPPHSPWLLFYDGECLFLFSHLYPEYKPFCIDYLSRDFSRRWRSFSQQDILAKAIGVKKGVQSVLDATCGLGYDSFLLATLPKLDVYACERNPIVVELLMNAFIRLRESGVFEEFPLHFYNGSAKDFLANENISFDTIYMDPMFERSNKTAKQKKEMFLFREIVGNDEDSEELFNLALNKAKKRVVVKRADDTPPITKTREPSIVFSGKTVRYDVYLVK